MCRSALGTDTDGFGDKVQLTIPIVIGVWGSLALAACFNPTGDGAGNGPSDSSPAPKAAQDTQQGTATTAEDMVVPATTLRDGSIVIREEFDQAVQENTAEALRIFIARHPGHPLAELAQQRLEDCFGDEGQQADTCRPPDSAE